MLTVLEALRTYRGMSRMALAKASKVSPIRIREIEMGLSQKINVPQLKRLSDELGWPHDPMELTDGIYTLLKRRGKI